MSWAVAVDGPFDLEAMLQYFRPRAIGGVEAVEAGAYRRVDRWALADGVRPVVEISDGPAGVVGKRPGGPERSGRDGPAGVVVRRPGGPERSDPDGILAATTVAAARRLLGLDANHRAALAHLRDDPVVGPRVRANPGLRVPGTWDLFETGVRAIVGQQVSVAGASTVTARIVARHGRPLAADPEGAGPDPDADPDAVGARRDPSDVGGAGRSRRAGAPHRHVGPGARDAGRDPAASGLRYAFPGPEQLADADLDGLGLTGARIVAVRGFAAAVAGGAIPLARGTAPAAPDLEALTEAITAVRGLGPWTAHYLAIRAGHPDAFPVGDLGLQRAAGLDAKALAALAERWRPHRALAAVHLWETPAP